MRITAVLLFIPLLLTACASVGTPFDISRVAELQPGASTEADALRLFGKPASMISNPTNRHTLLNWQYSSATLGVVKARQLSVSFDENGRMLAVLRLASLGE